MSTITKMTFLLSLVMFVHMGEVVSSHNYILLRKNIMTESPKKSAGHIWCLDKMNKGHKRQLSSGANLVQQRNKVV